MECDDSGRALRLDGTYADINDRKVAEGRLRRLAEFDSLTDLPNRALFHDRLQQAMVRATRVKLERFRSFALDAALHSMWRRSDSMRNGQTHAQALCGPAL